MRWSVEEKRKRVGWQDWFAWYPVCIGESWVLWEYVQRRGIHDGSGFYWDYREAQ